MNENSVEVKPLKKVKPRNDVGAEELIQYYYSIFIL